MKKILVSSDSGKYIEADAGIDDGQLSASIITVNTSSFNTTQNGLLQIVGGRIEVITGSGNNYKINYDTTLGKFVAEYDTTGDLGGDLAGSSTAARVKSVQNVTGGVLPTVYGGTGKTSFSVGNLVTGNGDGLIYSGNADKIVSVDATGQYVFANKDLLSFTPITGTLVYLYTGSVGIDRTYNWQKPSGCRFVRVICQGGGGGGASGGRSDTGLLYAPGGGGGGNSEATFAATALPSSQILITVGKGGTGTAGTLNGGVVAGQAGGISSFGNYLYANGGSSTAAASTSAAGGVGYIVNGGGGGYGRGDVSPFGAGASITTRIGAPGGGAGAQHSNNTGPSGAGGAPFNGSQNPGVYYLQQGNNAVQYDFMYFKNYYLNSTSSLASISFPKLSCTGGSGGGGGQWVTNSVAGRGGNGAFGSGGGGGGCRPASFSPNTNGSGGNGGAGYVLIICY